MNKESIGRAVDKSGQKFGRLTVLSYAGRDERNIVMWLCKCECGNFVKVRGYELGKRTNSCGCLKREIFDTGKSAVTHGMSKTRLYGIWASMKTRCYVKGRDSYAYYGGRGIKVCEEWKDSFETFRDWALNNGYKDELTLDRINGDGDYEADNCRWVTIIEQQSNKRNNVFLDVNSEKHTASEWSRMIGGSTHLVSGRLRRGWSVEDAVTIPPGGKRGKVGVADGKN